MNLESLFHPLISFQLLKALSPVSSPTLPFFVGLLCQKEGKKARERGKERDGQSRGGGGEGGIRKKKERVLSAPSLITDY